MKYIPKFQNGKVIKNKNEERELSPNQQEALNKLNSFYKRNEQWANPNTGNVEEYNKNVFEELGSRYQKLPPGMQNLLELTNPVTGVIPNVIGAGNSSIKMIKNPSLENISNMVINSGLAAAQVVPFVKVGKSFIKSPYVKAIQENYQQKIYNPKKYYYDLLRPLPDDKMVNYISKRAQSASEIKNELQFMKDLKPGAVFNEHSLSTDSYPILLNHGLRANKTGEAKLIFTGGYNVMNTLGQVENFSPTIRAEYDAINDIWQRMYGIPKHEKELLTQEVVRREHALTKQVAEEMNKKAAVLSKKYNVKIPPVIANKQMLLNPDIRITKTDPYPLATWFERFNQNFTPKYKVPKTPSDKEIRKVGNSLPPQPEELNLILKQGGRIFKLQNGNKLRFLQPNDKNLPTGRIHPFYYEPSSELASSIGGEQGEPAYLIPTFKYGIPLSNPIKEFEGHSAFTNMQKSARLRMKGAEMIKDKNKLVTISKKQQGGIIEPNNQLSFWDNFKSLINNMKYERKKEVKLYQKGGNVPKFQNPFKELSFLTVPEKTLPDKVAKAEETLIPKVKEISAQTFGEAFKQARLARLKGGPKTFTWTNPKTGETKEFGTYLEGEKNISSNKIESPTKSNQIKDLPKPIEDSNKIYKGKDLPEVEIIANKPTSIINPPSVPMKEEKRLTSSSLTHNLNIPYIIRQRAALDQARNLIYNRTQSNSQNEKPVLDPSIIKEEKRLTTNSLLQNLKLPYNIRQQAALLKARSLTR